MKDYIVKETNIWFVQGCESEKEAKQRVMYQKRIGLTDRIIEVLNIENPNIKIGKWAAFTVKGMTCVLHGKVIGDHRDCFTVKCKNGVKRRVYDYEIFGFYDSKEECYSVK